MQLSDYTIKLLEDIEKRIDPETEEDYKNQWKNFWYGKTDTDVFVPERKKVSSAGIEVKDIHINDAINDFELMLCSELASVSKRLNSTTDSLGIRANYGTGIMTSLFGAELFEMPRSTNTLPTTKSWNDSDKIRETLDKGIPDLNSGLGKKVLYFGEMCNEVFEKYPKIKKYVDVYHPDTQGPLDIAELLWGGEMFYEMYDDPDFVHSVLRLITDTYKSFLDKWYTIIPKNDELSTHWTLMHKGNILIRLDSAMNISTEFYNEFSKPYDSELFKYFGGGCIHFCGRGDHYIDSLCETEDLYGINMSQPELNDMGKILGTLEKYDMKIFALPNAQKYANEINVKRGIING